jgi:hypothetical protein
MSGKNQFVSFLNQGAGFINTLSIHQNMSSQNIRLGLFPTCGQAFLDYLRIKPK